MTKHTSRDTVWNQALQLALTEGSFKLSRIRQGLPSQISNETVRDTVKTMADHGWLSKEKSQADEWESGPQIQSANTVRENHRTSDVTHVADVSSLSEGKVYTGTVERFSNSDNANVGLPPNLDRDFVNLGPISEESEGEIVIFRFIETGWGECLDEKYTYSGYDPKDGLRHSTPPDSPADTSKQRSKSKTFGSGQSSKRKTQRKDSPFKDDTRTDNGLLNNKNVDS